MNLRLRLECLRRRFAWWLLGLKHHDVSIRDGDWIYHVGWHAPVQVVSSNYALCAVAVRLGPKGGIVVWPMDARSWKTEPPRTKEKS